MGLLEGLIGAEPLGANASAEHEWLRRQLLRFPTQAARRQWLTSPHPELEGESPLTRLGRDPARVATLLGDRTYYPHRPIGSDAQQVRTPGVTRKR